MAMSDSIAVLKIAVNLSFLPAESRCLAWKLAKRSVHSLLPLPPLIANRPSQRDWRLPGLKSSRGSRKTSAKGIEKSLECCG